MINLEKEINNIFRNKTLLITGGTGSFGKVVLKIFVNKNLKKIIIFSRDEKKQEDLRAEMMSEKIQFILGDIRDFKSINFAMRDVDYVFHAAALKQVPSCDFHPMEAVSTNILGTDNVLRAAIENKIKKLIFLSTDKAVYPINAMGISKSMAEKIVQSKARSISKDTIFCITRYGNVMNSRGSAIPKFIDFIKNNEKITVTDPSMTRFMMSLKDSLNLVLFAFLKGNQGDIFIQKAKGCSVGDLTTALQKIFKKNVGTKIIGSRHGEKLFETLVSREEMSNAIDLGKFFKIKIDKRDLNYANYNYSADKKINSQEDFTSHNTEQLNMNNLIKFLKEQDFIKNSL